MLDGNDRGVTSFELRLKRTIGSQYINTCSLGLSETSGYNSNVQVGDAAHIYCDTLYGSKSTQADDTRGYVAVCTAMTKRIKKEGKEALEEGKDVENVPRDFTEGLKQILQAIYANISSYIISPTLAHHIITTGSRFIFSHETKLLLLAQMEDYLYGKYISFTLRPTKGDKKKLWPDSQVNVVIFRHDSLENVYYYEFIEKYKVQNLPSNPDTILRFQRNRLGYHTRVVKQRDSCDVPMIYMPLFSDLYCLERDIDEKIIEERNIYAFPLERWMTCMRTESLRTWESFGKLKTQTSCIQRESVYCRIFKIVTTLKE